MIRICFLSSILLTGLAGAQSSSTSLFIPDNSPTTGNLEFVPMGQARTSTNWTNQKYQTLIPGRLANTIRINDLGFAPSTTNLHRFESITIKMDILPSTTTVLDPTFSNNLTSNAVTVLDARDYVWHLEKDKWNRIGLQRDFFWSPKQGNLLIEIEVRGAGALVGSTGGFRASTTIERLYAAGWTTQPPAKGNTVPSLAALKIELVSTDADTMPLGQGCAGSNGTPALSFSGTSQLGKTLTVHLDNALANSAAAHILGSSNAAPLFPIDLGAAGAPGCSLYVALDVLFPVSTGTGSSQSPIQIPIDTTFVGKRLWNQFFVLDKNANNFGLVASNYGRILIGT